MKAETETPVAVPSDGMRPGKNGGMLRNGGGRLPSKVKEESLDAIRSGLPKAIKALVEKAASGDSKAIELCLFYGIGKPTDKLEVSGPEGGPIQHAVQELDDHERRALRDAIARELQRREAATA